MSDLSAAGQQQLETGEPAQEAQRPLEQRGAPELESVRGHEQQRRGDEQHRGQQQLPVPRGQQSVRPPVQVREDGDSQERPHVQDHQARRRKN